jgi:hypothetical protein
MLGVHLESSGLGTRLDARLVANAPAGPRDPHAFLSMAAPSPSGKAGAFRGAALDRLEDGATLKDDAILMPSNGALEGTRLRVLTWVVKMRPDAKGAGLWLNFHRTNSMYQLVKLPFGSGPLAEKARPGSDSQFDIDLGQFAPKDWDDRVRIRLVGEGVSAQIIDNASFQIF